PRRRRSNSWGAAPALPAWHTPSPWVSPWDSAWVPSLDLPARQLSPVNASNFYLQNGPQTALQIHPWLNGDSPSASFHFDLAPVQFAPMRAVGRNPVQAVILSVAELREAAFHPPLRSLRILHPQLPFWPIDLALPAGFAFQASPPISMGDVLVALHRSLHQRISHADWATLGPDEEVAVTRAFAQRCRGEAARSGVPPAQLRDREVAERNLGVKRVDFLRGKTVFKGLLRA
ncbi:hypothetical protein B0H13DRAFT_1564816, partial [Mycena leptocephala]